MVWWVLDSSDGIMQQVARESANHLRQLAIPEEHVTSEVSYGNYAMFNKPLGSIYRANVPRLKAIQGAEDPTIVS